MGHPKMVAIDFRMLWFGDAPPVAIILFGGVGIPNLSVCPLIDRS